MPKILSPGCVHVDSSSTVPTWNPRNQMARADSTVLDLDDKNRKEHLTGQSVMMRSCRTLSPRHKTLRDPNFPKIRSHLDTSRNYFMPLSQCHLQGHGTECTNMQSPPGATSDAHFGSACAVRHKDHRAGWLDSSERTCITTLLPVAFMKPSDHHPCLIEV